MKQTTKEMILGGAHVLVILFFLGLNAPLCHCKSSYFVVQYNYKFDKSKDACEAISPSCTVAEQCQPDNLAAMSYRSQWDQKFIWMRSDNSCPLRTCPAISVNSADIKNVSWVCRPCSEANFVMCETNAVAPSLSVRTHISTINIPHQPNDLTCDMNWIQKGNKEFMVVMTRLAFREATMYCTIVHRGGLMNIRYARNDTGFLRLPSSVPFFWIATPVPGNTSYAYTLPPHGKVETQPLDLLSESICQREYRTTVPPPTTTSTSTTTPTTTSTSTTTPTTTSTSTTTPTTTSTSTTTPTTTSTSTTTPTTTSTSTTTPTTTSTSTTTPTTTSTSTTTPTTTSTSTTTPTTTSTSTTTPTTTSTSTTTPTTTSTSTTTPTTTSTSTTTPTTPSTSTTTPTTTSTSTTAPTTTSTSTTTPTTKTTSTTTPTTSTTTSTVTNASTTTHSTTSTTTFSTTKLTTTVPTPKDPTWIKYRFNEYYVNPNNLTYEASQRFCKEQMNATLVFFYQIGMYIRLVRERLLNISSGSFWVASDSAPKNTTCFNIDVNNYEAVLYGLDMDCGTRKGSICARAIRHNSTEDLINEVMRDPEFIRMIEEMTIKKNTTRKSLRKRISVRDHSAEQAGTTVSIVLMVVSFASFMLCDLPRIRNVWRTKDRDVERSKERRRSRSKRDSEA